MVGSAITLTYDLGWIAVHSLPGTVLIRGRSETDFLVQASLKIPETVGDLYQYFSFIQENRKMRRSGVIISVGVFLVIVNMVAGWSSRAPPKICFKENANQPHHSAATTGELIKPQQGRSPYQITASSREYQPGGQINVEIRGDTAFQGFFIQARDTKTGEWIGKFSPVPHTTVDDECHGISHADPEDKEEAMFVWNAPNDRAGEVCFTGSVLKDHDTFWVDLGSDSKCARHQRK